MIGAAITVHQSLGPGLLESVYEICLAHELACRAVPFQSQRPVPIRYRGVELDTGYRLDLIVGGELIVEVKCVDRLHELHEAQVLTYLRLTGAPVGLLINFNVRLLRQGLRRYVLGAPEQTNPSRPSRLRG